MLDRGETPPGWEPQAADNSMYQFFVNTCQRVSIGGFERGPASFLIESHWGINPPDSCREFEPDFDQAATLLSLWVDDPQLADFLRETYHMPVRIGVITNEIESQGGAEIQQWAWQSENGGESTIAVVHPGGSSGRAPFVARLVWHNGTGVSFLDLNENRVLTDVFAPTAQGVLAPPMRYAEQGMTPFAGLTSVWKEGDNYGPIYRFGDLECKEPLA